MDSKKITNQLITQTSKRIIQKNIDWLKCCKSYYIISFQILTNNQYSHWTWYTQNQNTDWGKNSLWKCLSCL